METNKIHMLEMHTNLGTVLCTSMGFWREDELMDALQEAIRLNKQFESRPVEGISRCEYKVKTITHS